jgi:hypothetical protein
MNQDHGTGSGPGAVPVTVLMNSVLDVTVAPVLHLTAPVPSPKIM